MIPSLEKYIHPDFVYCFTQGPDRVPDEATARQDGLNCIALAHLAIKSLFNVSLPPSSHCYEMFNDTERFETIASLEFMQTGDLVWFGRQSPKVPVDEYVPNYDRAGTLTNWQDNPIKHVAIYTGDTLDDDYLLLHATHTEKGSAIWPLHKFKQYTRYERVYRISRLLLAGHNRTVF